jgi:hypothetical protein
MTNKIKKSQQNTENLKDELQGPCNKKKNKKITNTGGEPR